MSIYYQDESTTLLLGDARHITSTLPADSVDCVVTSPPYFGLRDYGQEGQYGKELGVRDYVDSLVETFNEIRKPLKRRGTLWVNLGDSYNAYNGNRGASKTGFSRNDPLQVLPKGFGLTEKTVKNKSLIGVPWRFALAMQDAGWILRNDIIWHKPNHKPESVRDRFVASHEHVFMFTQTDRYDFDLTHVQGDGRKPGDVWSVKTQPFRDAHFATYPPEIPRRCISAGSPEGGVVLDPFSGSATTGMAALDLGRKYIGIDINPEYHDLALRARLSATPLEGVDAA